MEYFIVNTVGILHLFLGFLCQELRAWKNVIYEVRKIHWVNYITALPGNFLKFAGMQQSRPYHLKLLDLLKHANFTCLHILLFFEVTANNMKNLYLQHYENLTE